MFNATRLAVARKRRQLTKKALAIKANVSQVTLTRIETGTTTDPDEETVAALARALSFPVEFSIWMNANNYLLKPSVSGACHRSLRASETRRSRLALSPSCSMIG